jgi:hypothetical protein
MKKYLFIYSEVIYLNWVKMAIIVLVSCVLIISLLIVFENEINLIFNRDRFEVLEKVRNVEITGDNHVQLFFRRSNGKYYMIPKKTELPYIMVIDFSKKQIGAACLRQDYFYYSKTFNVYCWEKNNETFLPTNNPGSEIAVIKGEFLSENKVIISCNMYFGEQIDFNTTIKLISKNKQKL